jgi:hypothetical protein
MFGCTYMPTMVGNLVVAVECLELGRALSDAIGLRCRMAALAAIDWTRPILFSL